MIAQLGKRRIDGCRQRPFYITCEKPIEVSCFRNYCSINQTHYNELYTIWLDKNYDLLLREIMKLTYITSRIGIERKFPTCRLEGWVSLNKPLGLGTIINKASIEKFGLLDKNQNKQAIKESNAYNYYTIDLSVEAEECFIRRINNVINNDPKNLMKNFGSCTYVSAEMRFCGIVGLFLRYYSGGKDI